MNKKRPYAAPSVTSLDPAEVPAVIREQLELERIRLQNRQTLEVGRDHKYLKVSDAFAKQLGFRPDELVGKTVEDITAPRTTDVNLAFRALEKIGELDGLWMFKHRLGKRVLVHYHAWMEKDRVRAECETVLIAG